MIAHINIGSNRGDSKTLIGLAVAAIASRWPEAALRVSAPVVSEPWGFRSEHSFTNVGVSLEFPRAIDAPELLRNLLGIQNSLSGMPHRNPDGSYCDRELDIDLIAVDCQVVTTPELTLPHPRMHLRPFVLIPMAELEPSWRHPLLHLTPGEMLRNLADTTGRTDSA